MRKSTSEKYTIREISRKGITLEDELGTLIAAQCHEFLANAFKSIKSETEKVLDCNEMLPAANLDWKFELIAARLRIALDAVHAENLVCCKNPKVFLEPSAKKGVCAMRNFPGKQLVLTPLTPSVVKNR